MSIYGCHNRQRPTIGMPLPVQDGYTAGLFDYEAGNTDRIDRIITVPFAMTTACQYTQQHASDPLCAGCEHRHRDG